MPVFGCHTNGVNSITHSVQSVGEGSGSSYHTVELIPGEEYLVIIDPDEGDVPDGETVEELVIQAYERRGTETLSAGQIAGEMLRTLADYMAAGVVGQVALMPFVATVRHVRAWRSRARPTRTEEQIVRRCEVAVRQIPEVVGEPRTVSVTHGGENGWTVTVTVGNQEMTVVTEPSGTQFSISISMPSGDD